jgi:hypothetical protein
MKQLIIFILIAATSSTASAQAIMSSSYTASGEVDIKGNPLMSKPLEAEGSPYLNVHWGKGLVKLKSGKWHREVILKFDLQNNTLYFERGGVAFSFTDTVVEFFLAYEEEGESFSYIYRSGFPSVDKQTEMDFYEVVKDGKNLQLLKFNDKIIAAKGLYGQENKKEYRLLEQLYAYDVRKKSIVKIKKEFSYLRKVLPEYADKISLYRSKGNKRLQKEEDVKELFAYLETQE